MPPSWYNEGKGGITIRESGDATVLVSCASGSRTVRPGQDLHFDFHLLLTPFKPLDTRFQWSGMIGYWSPRCPVRTGNTDVLATAYVQSGEKTLVSVASWAQSDAQVRLSIDWRALGLDPATEVIIAPEIRDFQPAATFRPGDPIPVSKGKGWPLIICPPPE